MKSPEIILLGGAPGSGKSSIAERVVARDTPHGVRHLSIGDLKRSIVAGKTPSAFTELLQNREHPNRKTGSAPSEAMTGIMEEFILLQPGGLTIEDGFPRYMDRVVPFKESMHKIGANVLALCVVQLDEAVLVERLGGREDRAGQKIKDPRERLADHNDNIVPTLNLLAEDYPYYGLDGSLPLDDNAKLLVQIYHESSRSELRISPSSGGQR